MVLEAGDVARALRAVRTEAGAAGAASVSGALRAFADGFGAAFAFDLGAGLGLQAVCFGEAFTFAFGLVAVLRFRAAVFLGATFFAAILRGAFFGAGAVVFLGLDLGLRFGGALSGVGTATGFRSRVLRRGWGWGGGGEASVLAGSLLPAVVVLPARDASRFSLDCCMKW